MGLNPSSDISLGKLVKFSKLRLPYLQSGRNTGHLVGLQEG